MWYLENHHLSTYCREFPLLHSIRVDEFQYIKYIQTSEPEDCST